MIVWLVYEWITVGDDEPSEKQLQRVFSTQAAAEAWAAQRRTEGYIRFPDVEIESAEVLDA